MLYSKVSKIHDISIISVSEKENSKWMAKIHSNAEKALNFYIELFGFYPFSSLTILEGDSDCGGGYPQNEGVIIVHKKPMDSRNVESSWKWIVAHEIGHMYWGYYVFDGEPRKNSKLGWVTKGLGLYFDYLFLVKEKLEFPIHTQMEAQYFRAKKSGQPVSFNLTEKQKRTLTFDYNMVVDHGKSFYIVKKIAELLGSEKFLDICKGILVDYASKEITIEKLVLYISDNYKNDFIYEFDAL